MSPKPIESTSTSTSMTSYKNVEETPREFLARFDDFLAASPKPKATAGRPGREKVSSLPPPYEEPTYPAPPYNEVQEPPTLPKYLFKYGFFFPPFWAIGAIVLAMKLEPAPPTECGKTAEEQAMELAILRRAEVRWSLRCLLAFTCFLLVIGGIVIGVLAKRGVFKHH